MPNLILLRHGQSQWNLENRFTGWVDVDLSPLGEEEAANAGNLIQPYTIDYVFTSVLTRAIRTSQIALETAKKYNIPTERSEALNERHYGDLQGLNKAETAQQYGDEQVHIWRRSYDIPPPNGESLQMTQERVLPYYRNTIKPKLAQGANILVVAHGNSLRALVAELDKMTKEEILELNIPTGIPLLYTLTDSLEVIEKKYL
ncbi:MAG TPA: 2,3-bisphosphoglycerate-dependent phosphoglycerate mutase [Candidatus Kapabacteria bacterium]|nr:2,3-bisphosphoglycerate-dependent phosphoglycerate mutase [Ignavibacteria bacterium]HRK59675.1 2,3-bisphosphoglycerate-dependent phosphoglycerate mutase [Candidatus Kapabacteria bacterium]